jgi:3-polyprenyl-4-hydroxybenzoate decarboxylase
MPSDRRPSAARDRETSMIEPKLANAVRRTRITTLRDWLDHLAANDQLAVTRPGVGLRHEIAAIAKSFDGQKATFFLSLDGHAIPVVSGLLGDRT